MPSSSSAEGPATDSRWLCSELVRIQWTDASGAERAQVANIEEIWRLGAVLDAEEPVPSGVLLRLVREEGSMQPATNLLAAHASDHQCELRARVSDCRKNAAGFTLSVEFEDGWEWSPERLPLAHGVNAFELEKKAAEARDGSAEGTEVDSGDPDSVESPKRTIMLPDAKRDLSRKAAHRAADEALEQGSLFCLSLQTNRR